MSGSYFMGQFFVILCNFLHQGGRDMFWKPYNKLPALAVDYSDQKLLIHQFKELSYITFYFHDDLCKLS